MVCQSFIQSHRISGRASTSLINKKAFAWSRIQRTRTTIDKFDSVTFIVLTKSFDIILCAQVRLLILEKHGGIWMDVDSVILRDLRPFIELTGEFLSLSCSLRSFFNNNVMGFRTGSANIHTLINMVCGMGPWPTDHGDYNNKVAMIGGDPTFMADWYVVLILCTYGTEVGGGEEMGRGEGEGEGHADWFVGGSTTRLINCKVVALKTAKL